MISDGISDILRIFGKLCFFENDRQVNKNQYLSNPPRFGFPVFVSDINTVNEWRLHNRDIRWHFRPLIMDLLRFSRELDEHRKIQIFHESPRKRRIDAEK